MSALLRVAAPPPKPVVLYDGDCTFCRTWIRRWRQTTGDRVDYLSYQTPLVAGQFPELARADLAEAMHLVEADGSVRRGAEAVCRALAYGCAWPLWIYEHVPGASQVAESAYRTVARHRVFFSWLTRLLWGAQVEQPSCFLVRWLFLRGLGLIYLVAFLSLGSQILGLLGRDGILPAEQTMQQAAERSGHVGWRRYIEEPTLCWFQADDRFLQAQCVAGAVLSALVIAGIAQGPCLLLLWILYLSLTTVGGVFLGFQWDNLLLETGLLAVFFAPVRLWSDVRKELPPSRLVLWLLRWLLFRLMFASGCVKLLSGDAAWRGLTALSVHYETQPLPTWPAWYAHQLPPWAQQASCATMFFIELAMPFCIWLPRRLRFLAFVSFVLLQLAILITGNYTFFNYLALVLCLTLLDDSCVVRFFPHYMQLRLGEALAWKFHAPSPGELSRLQQNRAESHGDAPDPTSGKERSEQQGADPCWSQNLPANLRRFCHLALEYIGGRVARALGGRKTHEAGRDAESRHEICGLGRRSSHPRRGLQWLRRLPVAALALVIAILTAAQMLGMFRVAVAWPSAVVALYDRTAPFRSVNSYGLFAVMTSPRLEIVLEGSHDGRNWRAYEFKDKPGDLKRPPRFIAPHQPRLDWQMWFAALGNIRQNPWLISCCVKLLQGSPRVLALLKENPFPEGNPKFVRALLYEYHFTTPAQRRADGSWWRREYRGVYCPPLTTSPAGAK